MELKWNIYIEYSRMYICTNISVQTDKNFQTVNIIDLLGIYASAFAGPWGQVTHTQSEVQVVVVVIVIGVVVIWGSVSVTWT